MLVFSFLLIARLSFLSAAMRPFPLYVPRLQVVFSAALLLVLPWGSHEFILAMSGARIIPHKHGVLFPDHYICYTSKTWRNDQRRSAKSWITILFFNCSLRPHFTNIYIFDRSVQSNSWELWLTRVTYLSWKAWISIFAGWNKGAAYICAVFNNFA